MTYTKKEIVILFWSIYNTEGCERALEWLRYIKQNRFDIPEDYLTAIMSKMTII